ncbi:hypothetical protein [Burkholderia ubonensis]|uniref:hypothetical protein n=1 Tax=Burkholderia ubonensis TaxID=101571 RepID=UPI00075DF503|nr:hypothetical protein [Burkholderia ubonensis]KWN17605.1 hypothetical protein WM21_08235 [Burkholderia ubonensis]
MRLSCALLFAASLVTDIAHAAPDESLYRGTIGKSPIVLRFYQNDKQAIGRYFYRSQGIDIGLVPTVNAGEFIECPLSGGGDEPTACAEPTGVWSLSFASGSASGTWRKSAGAVATLPIRLERTSATCDANFHGSSATERSYDCLRVEGPTEISARKGTSADRAVTWRFITEKRSGASTPQLTSAPSADAMRTINAELDRVFRETVGLALMARPKGDSSCTPTVAFANTRLFTVDATCYWDWPGAVHPSSGWNTTTYDLATGKPLDWTRTVRFPAAGTETFDFTKGNDVVSLALRRAVDERNDKECIDQAFRSFECDDSRCRNQGAKKMADWKWSLLLSPRKEGLFAAFNAYSEAERNCRGEGVLLPWRDVHALLLAPRTLP